MRRVTKKQLLAFESSVLESHSLNQIQKRFLLSLSEEQRKIILCDAKYCLVRSAAGSGKTTVLVAKYLYLTRVLGVPKNKIVYLSFNNRNVDDTAAKLHEIKVSKSEIASFTFTFHALALRIINAFEGVWPELLEQVRISWNNADTDHDKAEVYLSKYRDELAKKIETDPSFRKSIIQCTVRSKGNHPHRYVSYYLDRNGIPGSCRSKQERDIFDKLAKSGVDFAYEEPDRINHRRPDFTLYNQEGQRVIFEHFTAASRQELETIGTGDGERYMRTERAKLLQYPKVYGKDKCIFTFGANRTIEDIWAELKIGLKDKGVAFDESKERKEQLTTDKLLEIVVEKYKEVRNQIVETGNDVMTVAKKMSLKKGYVGYFFKRVFIPIEQRYSEFISSTKGGYTDFADSIVKATGYCKQQKSKLAQFSFDHVLVDEFQDISISRHELLKSLKMVNPQMKLMAVGDDWQSIYSFSCSDLDLFYNFRDNWEKTKSVEMDMSETFRFGGDLLKASSSFIRKDTQLSNHSVRAGIDNQTQLILKSFESTRDFQERRSLQWGYIKDKMVKELKVRPKTKFLVLSRYSNIARWFLNDLRKNDLFDPKKQDDICLTIHRAKGLTADVVFIQECQKRAIPLVKTENELSEHDKLLALVRGESMGAEGYAERYQEERRLFYVALTRAKKKVYILYDEALKSDFVNEILPYGVVE